MREETRKKLDEVFARMMEREKNRTEPPFDGPYDDVYYNGLPEEDRQDIEYALSLIESSDDYKIPIPTKEDLEELKMVAAPVVFNRKQRRAAASKKRNKE